MKHRQTVQPCRAQRLTASEVSTVASVAAIGMARQVLNALRHQRYQQLHKMGNRFVANKCSTPYGIRGINRDSKLGSMRMRTCGAQRLTASEVSTGRLRRGLDAILLVLNALRHQRYQQRPAPRWKLATWRAQRLTASEVSTGLSGLPKPRLNNVCSTPYGIRGINRLASELFTHWRGKSAQRLTASEVSTGHEHAGRRKGDKRCSTPYGIRGINSRDDCLRLEPHDVCSTPYGIRGINSRASLSGYQTGTCAQRLTASEVSTVAEIIYYTAAAVCSTPYGIRGINSTSGFTRWPKKPSAQRLTASEVSTDFAPQGIRPRQGKVLNALRHQRYQQTKSRLWRILNLECSTPYGIRGINSFYEAPASP